MPLHHHWITSHLLFESTRHLLQTSIALMLSEIAYNPVIDVVSDRKHLLSNRSMLDHIKSFTEIQKKRLSINMAVIVCNRAMMADLLTLFSIVINFGELHISHQCMNFSDPTPNKANKHNYLNICLVSLARLWNGLNRTSSIENSLWNYSRR